MIANYMLLQFALKFYSVRQIQSYIWGGFPDTKLEGVKNLKFNNLLYNKRQNEDGN